MNNKKGISLIVLVITILVMIILAGVVIVSLQKNNPVEKAKKASSDTNEASIKEAVVQYALNLNVVDDKDAEMNKVVEGTFSADGYTTKYYTKGENVAQQAGTNITSDKPAKETALKDNYFMLKLTAGSELGVDVSANILGANRLYVNFSTGDSFIAPAV